IRQGGARKEHRRSRRGNDSWQQNSCSHCLSTLLKVKFRIETSGRSEVTCRRAARRTARRAHDAGSATTTMRGSAGLYVVHVSSTSCSWSDGCKMSVLELGQLPWYS